MQPLLGLVNDTRNTDLGKTTMRISNLFVGLAEYSAIRVEGIIKI
jgi:hypothetical protein